MSHTPSSSYLALRKSPDVTGFALGCFPPTPGIALTLEWAMANTLALLLRASATSIKSFNDIGNSWKE
jgi:hypothetical protein